MKPIRTITFAISILLILLLSIHHTGHAQSPNQAGLVVEFGDGSLYTGCINFDADNISGYDLLARSGLALETAFDPGQGVAVCKINSDGCPSDDCFCQMPEYWSYWNLGDGDWGYAGSGSSLNRVGNGDVDGWSWGEGSPPPVYTFDQLCAPPPPPTETLPPTPTATHTPEPQPSDTPEPEPSDTLVPPSATTLPTHTPLPDSPTPNPAASHTSAPRPSATNTSMATRTAVTLTSTESLNHAGNAFVPAPTNTGATTSPTPGVSQEFRDNRDGSESLVGYAIFGALLISLGLALTRIIMKGKK